MTPRTPSDSPNPASWERQRAAALLEGFFFFPPLFPKRKKTEPGKLRTDVREDFFPARVTERWDGLLWQGGIGPDGLSRALPTPTPSSPGRSAPQAATKSEGGRWAGIPGSRNDVSPMGGPRCQAARVFGRLFVGSLLGAGPRRASTAVGPLPWAFLISG